MASPPTQLHDLPDPLLPLILSLLSDVRSRNAAALVSRKWRAAERHTRSALALRGHLRSPFLLPTCFPSITHLDLSLLSPWGHHPFPDDPHHLLARRLALTFPSVTSLTVYSRHPSVLAALAPRWPTIKSAKLVRWHQRPPGLPLGADLAPLLAACPSLSDLDLSEFYCWTEDVPQALKDYPLAAASLRRLNLLSSALAGGQGFNASEIRAVAESCPNLTALIVPCVFNPRCFDFVGDELLDSLAASCPRLGTLHLVDAATLGSGRGEQEESAAADDAAISGAGLERLFMALPQLEDFALDLCHVVRDARPALEAMSVKCPKIRSLKLGNLLDLCRGIWEHLDGVAVCGGLVSLCIKNCADLTDDSLATIARGCRRLSRFEIHGCNGVTELGVKRFVSALRPSLVDVRISGCRRLDAHRCLRALEPIRDRVEFLHIDCVWFSDEADNQSSNCAEKLGTESELDEVEDEVDDEPRSKKCRYTDVLDENDQNGQADIAFSWLRTWDRLRHLSLWVPVGEVLTPLADSGLEDCPNLEEVTIKIEGDCRFFPKPRQIEFGLNSLAHYPQLSKLKLDCSEAIGYALTAPTGHMDLSLWERFYLHGIADLNNLYELDYWPPQDKDVNQRCLSLPATGLIQECATLRKLFIHGTAHEHFICFFLKMPMLRDVQLREDYYPAPENDTSTEMRVASWSRFEEALNNRMIPD